jgi:TM2 domain-containing membrane protein YozV
MSQPPYSLPGSTGEGAPQLTPTHGLPGQHSVQYGPQPGESDKSFIVTWLLGWLLGGFGADRFYLGKIGTAIAKLVTAGGFGIWALIDLIMHLVGSSRDKQGRRLAGYDQHKKKAWIITGLTWLFHLTVGITVTVILLVSSGVAVSGGVSTGSGQQPTDSSPLQPGDGHSADTSQQTSSDQGNETSSEDFSDITAWAESTFGTFDSVTVDGSGDEIVPIPDGVEAALITLEVKGEGEYAGAHAVARDEEDSNIMSLSGTAGDTLQGDVGPGNYPPPAGIEVWAGGNWSLTFEPVASAPTLPEAGSGSGTFLYDGNGGSTAFEHSGESYFIVQQLSYSDPALITDEILAEGHDNWSGSTELAPGPSIIRIQASGDWTITPG